MTKEIENELDSLYTEYEKEVYKVAKREFENIVVPFLKDRKWSFVSGMGTWWIGPDKNRYSEDYPEDEEFKEIEDLLKVNIEGMNQELGSLMPEYRP